MSHDARRQPAPESAAGTDPDGVAPPAPEPSGADRRPDGGRGDGGGGGGSTRRFWSARRVPAAIVALLLAVAAAVLLYEAVAASIDKSPSAWRREVTADLAARPLDDPWAIAGAALAVLLGLWLAVLAVTPGLRGLLPMRGGSSDGVRMRAGLERSAAEAVLHDRLLDVPGVRSVRVSAGRHRIKVRARAHFRPLEDVRGDLDRVLEEGVRQLGLARRMRRSVRVRRPKKG
ncbi:DUF6286 domain-containing protein [Streptomyces chitinivorans]|uniref:DUF6286 domain-containing protein n=1 Tax=Streptomyces chitinivorans TaxID=1257027 RepID=A0ABW7HTN0_9ACTN|nr:DUF6286 domain-containing protein [Streptomyces chitinivorans]MDH2410766.1 DUF6286 domain-containing protein [Streptomyces chitinivorans]